MPKVIARLERVAPGGGSKFGNITPDVDVFVNSAARGGKYLRP